MEALLVDGVAVQEAAVLAEAFTVVAEDYEDRLLVDPELLVLVYEELHEGVQVAQAVEVAVELVRLAVVLKAGVDRKSTRLNSSHANISYAVFCLKKKNIL